MANELEAQVCYPPGTMLAMITQTAMSGAGGEIGVIVHVQST